MAQAVKKPVTKKTTVAKKAKAPQVKKSPAKTTKATVKKVSRVTPSAKTSDKAESTRSLPVLSVDGSSVGRMQLPEELFAAKVNRQAIAQAVRVYLANQREGSASAKTRGEVEGSTRKIYRQKGTGRARHGSIRAPIFVGGGVVFGPRPRDYSLSMPQKMRRTALTSALTVRFLEGSITVVEGLETLEPKTKHMMQALSALGRKKENTLIVTDENFRTTARISRNIPGIEVIEARNLNAYQVMSNRKLIFMKKSIAELKNTFAGGK